MALDSMRVGGGRCPPIVVGLLLLLCFLLTCNWWSISTENTELLLQIDQLHEEIKISLEEREKCETLTANYELRYKKSEDTVAMLQVREIEMRKNNDELTNAVTVCNNEVDTLKQSQATKTAALQKMRSDKDAVSEQLNVKLEEAQKLQADLEKMKIELGNLNRTCTGRAAQAAQDQERNASKELANNLAALPDDNNADTAGEIDDELAVIEPSKHRSPSPDQDSVYNLVARNPHLATAKSLN